ncbi:MAG: hypothetical protein LBD71_01030 [Treponema sp.]|jgi:hypothetical protein|nr:hypothetical protein [Treponema sp.]
MPVSCLGNIIGAFIGRVKIIDGNMVNPRMSGGPAPDGCFKVFFSTNSGWGSFLLNKDSLELKLLYGTLTLKKFGLPDGMRSLRRASINNRNIEALIRDGLLVPSAPIVMEKGGCLKVFFQ